MPTSGPASTGTAFATTAATATVTPGPTSTGGLVQLVCFQEYSNSSCLTMVGPKSCSPQSQCTHIDVGEDKSSQQTCYSGYSSISIYRNSSSCRPARLAFVSNTTLGICGPQGARWGVTTCGELLCMVERGGGGGGGEKEQEEQEEQEEEEGGLMVLFFSLFRFRFYFSPP